MKHFNKKRLLATGSAWLCVLALASCGGHELAEYQPGQGIVSTNPKPEWAPDIDPQMQAITDELQVLQGPTPLYKLSVDEARSKPSVKDAVNSLLNKNKIAPPMLPVTSTMQTILGYLPIYIYKPSNVSGPLPVIVYYHGGGWVIADTKTYEASVQALAANVGAIVVSVDYRRAPEFKFPTAHEDAYAAYKWVKENAASLGGNPDKVAVAGESAGGNMSVGVCMMARDNNYPMPVHQLLVYPVANNDLTTESYMKYAKAIPLGKELVEWFVDKYFRTQDDGNNPLISLVDVADLHNLPPATLIAAEIDPLQTEGKQLADKLNASGVMTTYHLYQGVTHEFFGTYAIVTKAGEAQNQAAAELKTAFNK